MQTPNGLSFLSQQPVPVLAKGSSGRRSLLSDLPMLSTQTQALRKFTFLRVAEWVRAASPGSQAAKLDTCDSGDAARRGWVNGGRRQGKREEGHTSLLLTQNFQGSPCRLHLVLFGATPAHCMAAVKFKVPPKRKITWPPLI